MLCLCHGVFFACGPRTSALARATTQRSVPAWQGAASSSNSSDSKQQHAVRALAHRHRARHGLRGARLGHGAGGGAARDGAAACRWCGERQWLCRVSRMKHAASGGGSTKAAAAAVVVAPHERSARRARCGGVAFALSNASCSTRALHGDDFFQLLSTVQEIDPGASCAVLRGQLIDATAPHSSRPPM